MLYWQFIALSETPSQSYRISLAIWDNVCFRCCTFVPTIFPSCTDRTVFAFIQADVLAL